MIITITLILTVLVAFNFFLLAFSCNKTTKKTTIEKPNIINPVKAETPTKRLATSQLAPTGS
ncbi:hypothetical protein [Psychroserpens sp. SPM9]|uniref:hypothetical protein n=1 Tax=Psychroserpens sp. SPM9 TaxID=2975598 RepID=UPI0021A59BFC|nr:hypothetical protein [Psychroserpens sp. SPM9]MDG5491966.1 hypothetical protein [Psychroserpens sp. SPM9]